MGNTTDRVSIELNPAIKRSKMNTREVANAANVAWETLRGYIYKGKLPSVETLYFIATGIKQPIRIPGPHGTIVVRLEEGGTKTPSATTLPFIREEGYPWIESSQDASQTTNSQGFARSRSIRRSRSLWPRFGAGRSHRKASLALGASERRRRDQRSTRLYDLAYFVVVVVLPVASMVTALAWMAR